MCSLFPLTSISQSDQFLLWHCYTFVAFFSLWHAVFVAAQISQLNFVSCVQRTQTHSTNRMNVLFTYLVKNWFKRTTNGFPMKFVNGCVIHAHKLIYYNWMLISELFVFSIRINYANFGERKAKRTKCPSHHKQVTSYNCMVWLKVHSSKSVHISQRCFVRTKDNISGTINMQEME